MQLWFSQLTSTLLASDMLKTKMAQDGITFIIVTLLCIVISWWSLQAVKFEKFLRYPKSAQAKLLQVILACVIGYLFSRLLLDYSTWAFNIRGFL
ncbi:DUF1146 family protein [Longirhabdus pacifica]|uniref:DUF1146 family protein n=1 Tax=Longirhabdus pacifica TaxID=2305227 RepID=UPI0010087636|nr:DUF1146 family protein [Longirhabdus pacifica]